MPLIIHRAIGYPWEYVSLCGATVHLPTGEDVTARTPHDMQVTCKRCLKALAK